MKMSRTQTRFFLGKLSLFYKTAELARMLSVTRPTLERWLADENRPSVSYIPIFKEAYQALIDRLDEHGKQYGSWANEWASVLDELEFPAHLVTAVPQSESEAVHRFLHGQLMKAPKSTTLIYARAAELGFSRAQVLHAAKRLGVIKQQKSAGRGSTSIWRLP